MLLVVLRDQTKSKFENLVRLIKDFVFYFNFKYYIVIKMNLLRE